MTLVTISGRVFDYNNITKDSIYIPDIIHSLTGLGRFNGHSTRIYTVGEHTLMCLIMAEKLGFSNRMKLLTFIHDFTEGYCSDCPAPLKALLPEFQHIEGKIEMAIYEHLGIEQPTEAEYRLIKRIDLTMLVIEMRDLTLHTYENFINEYTYTSMLEDEEMKLDNELWDRDLLKESLHSCFEDLMDKVKEGK
jgi:5'-deoxynucleotidase YfbR-like HD superfamily hydrolase